MNVCPTPAQPALLGAPGMSLSPMAQANFSPDPAMVITLLLRLALNVTQQMVNSMYIDWTVLSNSSPVSVLKDFTPRQAASPLRIPSQPLTLYCIVV